eukprot:3149853-Heterocapsa_arctica.AAC.1
MVPRVRRFSGIPGGMELDPPRWPNGLRRARSAPSSLASLPASASAVQLEGSPKRLWRVSAL